MSFFFFFNDTATTEIYTLSLHDALPISCGGSDDTARRTGSRPDGTAVVPAERRAAAIGRARHRSLSRHRPPSGPDRKSTRLNSSHSQISYAVFCLKKKKMRDPVRFAEPA